MAFAPPRIRRVLGGGALALIAAALLGAAAFVASPLPPAILDRTSISALRFTDREGRPLREMASREDGRSIGLPPGQPIPPLVRAAFVAAEDRRFGSHPGIDPLALARALAQDLRARRIVSGASTIAEQLARQLVPRPRSLLGKAREAMWAVRLTVHLSRDALLRAYLDRIALGHDVFGVEAAAQLYFGRPASALSMGQAALLAGMAGSPARADPYRHPEAAQRRIREILRRMMRSGFVSAENARTAALAPLDLTPPSRVFAAPHLTAFLARSLPALGLDRAVAIETTLDSALQADLEALMREQLAGDPRVEQAAAIVVDNASGEVLAYAGSSDFLDEERQGQNDGVRSLRQPGSALKPFAYGLALSEGYTPATLLSDLEVHLSTPSGAYIPRNYDRRIHGPVRLRAALANSYNVPAVRVADALGVGRVLGVLRGAGFESLQETAEHYGVGIVLGNGDVTLRELARAYRGLSRGGVLEPLREIRGARDAGGRSLPVRREVVAQRFLPASAVAILTDILADETARAPAFGLDNALRLPFPVAAKTGTSHAYVDNWTVGFTAERTVAVWAGNFDGRPMTGVSGITGAAPIFSRIMARSMRGIAPRALVDRSRFEHARVCALSGQLAGSACPSAVEEVFLPGTKPQETCGMHRWLERAVLDVGPEFYGWARAEGLAAGPWPEPADDEPRRSDALIVLPGNGDEYLVEAGMPRDAQVIPVRVRPPRGAQVVEVRADDSTVLELGAPFAGRLPARPGRHRLELWVPGGAGPLAVSEFVVRGATE
jgi:penicillin-binding protein 1C